MKLYIKQKVFSWGDKFFVKDEDGNDLYYVKGEIFSLGKKLHIYGSNGDEAAFIRQKLIAFLPRFFVDIDGREVCQIVKELTLFRPRYRIEGLSWRLNGDYWAHEYSLTDNERQIMRLSKKWLAWGDTYELDIADPQNELICLCVALAVDAALALQKRSGTGHRHGGFHMSRR